MTYDTTQVKDRLLSRCGEMREEMRSQGLSKRRLRPLSKPLDIVSQPASLSLGCSLNCTVQALPNQSGLCARLSYYLPTQVAVSIDQIFYDADVLNRCLVNSQVFVVQDLDSDALSNSSAQRTYYLRMDTVATGRVDAQSISTLLDRVTQDVSVLMEYFSTATKR